MGSYVFTTDLQKAKVSELELSKLLKTYYDMDTICIGRNYKYDLFIRTNKQRDILLEVKEDFRCGETGNFLLEFEFKGKPSGIAKSTAEFYIHILHLKSGIEYWSTSTEKLKWMIEKKLYFSIVEGGDGSKDAEKKTGIRDATITTRNYLFKLQVFKKYSKQLFIEKVKVEN